MKDLITTINSWFIWHRCCLCNNEFRREPMWKIFIKRYSSMIQWHTRYDYVCSNCIKNIEEANNYRNDIINPPIKRIQEVPIEIRQAIDKLREISNIFKSQLHFNLIVEDIEKSINSIEKYILKMNKIRKD